MTIEMLRDLARYLLVNRNSLPRGDWTVQGFGFMRLRISPSLRLHVWDSRLRVPHASDIHDHAQWAFRSTVLAGSICNVRYSITDPGAPGALEHNMGTIKCGIGGGMSDEKPVLIGLLPLVPEMYTAGQSYSQEPGEVHRTMPTDGTVTIIEQFRRETDCARVFWPKGIEWGDAIPRKAETWEIEEVGGFALKAFG